MVNVNTHSSNFTYACLAVQKFVQMYNVFYTNCLQVSTSVRCLLPFGTDERELGQGYVRAKVFNQLHLPQDSQSAQVIERTFSHVFGLYCLLNGLILFHLAGITMLLLMLTNSTF